VNGILASQWSFDTSDAGSLFVGHRISLLVLSLLFVVQDLLSYINTIFFIIIVPEFLIFVAIESINPPPCREQSEMKCAIEESYMPNFKHRVVNLT